MAAISSLSKLLRRPLKARGVVATSEESLIQAAEQQAVPPADSLLGNLEVQENAASLARQPSSSTEFSLALEPPANGIALEITRDLAELSDLIPHPERACLLSLFRQGFVILAEILTDVRLLADSSLSRMCREGTLAHLSRTADSLRRHSGAIHRDYLDPQHHQPLGADQRRVVITSSERLAEEGTTIESQALRNDLSFLIEQCEQLPSVALHLAAGEITASPEVLFNDLPSAVRTALLMLLTTARARLHGRACNRILRSRFRGAALSPALCYALVQGHGPHAVLDLIREIPETHADARAFVKHLLDSTCLNSEIRDSFLRFLTDTDPAQIATNA